MRARCASSALALALMAEKSVGMSTSLVDCVAHEPELRREDRFRCAEIRRGARQTQQLAIELHIVSIAALRQIGGIRNLPAVAHRRGRAEVLRMIRDKRRRRKLLVERIGELQLLRLVAGRVEIGEIARCDRLTLYGT